MVYELGFWPFRVVRVGPSGIGLRGFKINFFKSAGNRRNLERRRGRARRSAHAVPETHGGPSGTDPLAKIKKSKKAGNGWFWSARIADLRLHP